MDFVLTSDLDWASETCVETFLQLAGRFSVVPTLFVTHDSPAARKASEEKRAELGIHPNFLPQSSHGESVTAVVDHSLRLVPQATVVRSHRYIDSAQIQAALVARGLEIDSNVCRHLERGLDATALPSGLHRFPVFFEDDVHWTRELSWSFERYAAEFFKPGLKILNFHPFFVALNIPDAEFYARHKHYISSLTGAQAKRLRFAGAGAETFLIEALRSILAAGHRFVSLSSLARSYGVGASTVDFVEGTSKIAT